MHTNIISKNFTLTEGIKGRINSHTEKLRKFGLKNYKLNVVLSANDDEQQVEIEARIYGKAVRVKKVSSDLYSAIDSAFGVLQAQIAKLSDRKLDRRESIRFKRETAFENECCQSEEEEKMEIVKRDVMPNKPMFEEEAILQIELLNRHSFIFQNADTDTVCMIYKTSNGYGIIEAEHETKKGEYFVL